MARTEKKNVALTMDEKLQVAIVPDIEQPHAIPENWCWTKVGQLCTLKNGRAFKPTDWVKTGIPIVRIQNLNDPDSEYNYFDGAVSDDNRLYGGELLFAWSGTPGTSFGAHIWKGKAAVLNQHIYRVDFDESVINKAFFMYAINQQLEMLISVAHGGAGLQHVTKGVFESTPIPLPPYQEQQRIVDRIESLFAKLDEAKEKAQAVVDGFEDCKAAILHKAFTGDITKKWREAQKIAPSCETVSIDSVCEALKYGTAKKSVASGDVVVIRMGNLQQGEIDWTNLAYSNDEEDNIKYKLFPGDVLFNRTNSPELVGKTAIYRGEYPAIYAGYLIKLDYDHSRVKGDYLNYILNSPEAKEYCSKVKSDGVNQSNINAKKIGAFTFRLPQFSEQQEIVDTVKSVLEKDKNAKDAAQQTIDWIESMRKAILARAFRGELGTNDPNDESAIELLKEVLSVETTPQPRKKGVTLPKEISGELKTELERKIVKLFIQKETDSLPIKDLMSISSKPFEALEALHDLEKRQIIKKVDNNINTYKLMR